MSENGLIISFVSFTDINECLDALCSHQCINSVGSYRCECPTGYVLQPNKHDCKGDNYINSLQYVV